MKTGAPFPLTCILSLRERTLRCWSAWVVAWFILSTLNPQLSTAAATPQAIHRWQYTDIIRTGIDKFNSNATAAAWLTFSTNWPQSNTLRFDDQFIGFTRPGFTNGIFRIGASNLAENLGQWITNVVGAGSGDVTTAQLNAASNVLRSLTIANDTTTSNGLVTLLVANDTTTSNALRTVLVANDTTTSNGVIAVLQANDITTSNGAVAITIAASNVLRHAFIANVSGLASNLYVSTASAGTVPVNIKGATGQGQNLAEFRNASDVILFQVQSNGVLVGTGGAGPRLLHTSTAGHVWTATGTDGTGGWAAITGGGDVTTAQLNTASNLLSGRIDLALTNNEGRIVFLNTNLTVYGRATNANNLTVHGGNIRLFATNGTAPALTLQDYGSAFPQIIQQNANGTEASPTALASGDVAGQYAISGLGDTIYKTAFSIRPVALGTFTDSASSTLVRLGVGDAAGTSLGRAALWLTAYNFTNDLNLVVNSNALVLGTLTNAGPAGFADAVLVNGLATFNGVSVGGAFASLGAANSFAQDLTVTGPLTTATNVFTAGTNRSRYVKLGGGATNNMAAMVAGDTNVVAHPAVSAAELSFLDGVTSAIQTQLDSKTGLVEMMTNGVRIRLSTNINLIAGPNFTIRATNNTTLGGADYWLDAPSSALSDGDKGSITVSGAGATWTVDNDAVSFGMIEELAGFSVFGKATTGTGNGGNITAGTDSVLRRSGSGDLAFGTLDTAQITDDAVTLGKMADMATARVLGRSSPGSGNPEALTASGGGVTISSGNIRLEGTVPATDLGTSTIILTNVFKHYWVDLGNSTNVVINWSATNFYRAWPSNTFTLSWINHPSAGGLAQAVRVQIINTNVSQAFFATNGPNGSTVKLLPAPSTNDFLLEFTGSNTVIWSYQDLTTGSGNTNVLNVSPVIHTADLRAPVATNGMFLTSTNVRGFVLGGTATNLMSLTPTNILASLVAPTSTNQMALTGTNVNAALIGDVGFLATNGLHAFQRAANSNAYAVTNIAGVINKASASVVVLNCNDANNFVLSNRLTAATSLIITNTGPGQEISITVLGEASGGSARVVTLIPQLGHLVADLDTFGTALATSTSFTLTNGNAAEISWLVQQLNGTNVAKKVSRQFAF